MYLIRAEARAMQAGKATLGLDDLNASPLPSTSRVWVFPIPQSEIDANPNIRDQQSPGWN